MMEERVHECSACMPWSRVNHKPRRLVHHKDVFVFIHHANRDLFSQELRISHGRDREVECASRNQRAACANLHAVHGEPPLADQTLDERTRETATICYESIRTLSRRFRRDRKINLSGVAHRFLWSRSRGGRSAARSMIKIPKLIPISATLKVQKRKEPAPRSMKSST